MNPWIRSNRRRCFPPQTLSLASVFTSAKIPALRRLVLISWNNGWADDVQVAIARNSTLLSSSGSNGCNSMVLRPWSLPLLKPIINQTSFLLDCIAGLISNQKGWRHLSNYRLPHFSTYSRWNHFDCKTTHLNHVYWNVVPVFHHSYSFNRKNLEIFLLTFHLSLWRKARKPSTDVSNLNPIRKKKIKTIAQLEDYVVFKKKPDS